MGICASNPANCHERISKHHFRVERVVGQGGFGVVNAVIKETLPRSGETFAMKSLRKHVILERNHTEMVFRERNLLARLRHPRLVNMHYAFQDEAHLYIIMDACLGGDLHYQIMQSATRRFTEMQTKFYAVCILQALEYMHDNGVLHRDIKPENLLLDERGQLRVTDLGVSGELDAAGNCFSTSGTRPYMAPEVFMSGHKHGKASDLYSLGITLHQFLTGQRPYRASRTNLKTIVRMAAFVPPETVRTRAHARRVLASAQERRSPSEEFALSRRLRAHSDACVDFVRGLLVCNAHYRLGSDGFKEIYDHPWLADINLDAVRNETARAPFVPDMSRAQCNVYDSDLARLLLNGEDSAPSAPTLLAEEQAKFEGYDYNTLMRDVADLDLPTLPAGPKAPQYDTRTRTDVTMASSVQSNGLAARRPASQISAGEAGAAVRRGSRESQGRASVSSVPPSASSAAKQIAPTGSRLPIEGGALQQHHRATATAVQGPVPASRLNNDRHADVATGAGASALDAQDRRGSNQSAASSSHSRHLGRSRSMPSRGAQMDVITSAQGKRLGAGGGGSGTGGCDDIAEGPHITTPPPVGAGVGAGAGAIPAAAAVPPAVIGNGRQLHQAQPHLPLLAPKHSSPLRPSKPSDSPPTVAGPATTANSSSGALRSVKSAGSIATGRTPDGLPWSPGRGGRPIGSAPAAEPDLPPSSHPPPVVVGGGDASGTQGFVGGSGRGPARSASTSAAAGPTLLRVQAGAGAMAPPMGARTPVGSVVSIVETAGTATGSSSGVNRQMSLAGRAGLESRAASFINNGSSMRSIPGGGADVVSAMGSMASIRSPGNDMGFGSPMGQSPPLIGAGFSSTNSGPRRMGEVPSSLTSSPATTGAGEAAASAGGTRSEGTAASSDIQSRLGSGRKLAPLGAVGMGGVTGDTIPSNMAQGPSGHDFTASRLLHGRSAAQHSSGSIANNGSFNMVPQAPGLSPHTQAELATEAARAGMQPGDAEPSTMAASGTRLGPLPSGPPPAAAGRVNLPSMRSFQVNAVPGAQLDVLAEVTHDDRSPSGSEGGVPLRLQST